MQAFRTIARLLRDLISEPRIEARRSGSLTSTRGTHPRGLKRGGFAYSTASSLLLSSSPFLVSLDQRSEVGAMLLKTWYCMIEAQSATQALQSSVQSSQEQGAPLLKRAPFPEAQSGAGWKGCQGKRERGEVGIRGLHSPGAGFRPGCSHLRVMEGAYFRGVTSLIAFEPVRPRPKAW